MRNGARARAARGSYSGAISQPAGAGESARYFTLRRGSAIIGSTASRHSREEPGVVRFDVVQQTDDPTRFVLVEIYRTGEDPARHKATAHYATWRDAVEPLMAEPRRSVKYHALSPAPSGWEMAPE